MDRVTHAELASIKIIVGVREWNMKLMCGLNIGKSYL